jgi:hypothetical protein
VSTRLLRSPSTAAARFAAGNMEMRDAALGEGPAGTDLGVIGSARAGTDGAHGPVRLATAWDGHAAPAESSAQPSCCVRVIKALDRGSGRYIVKEGVS